MLGKTITYVAIALTLLLVVAQAALGNWSQVLAFFSGFFTGIGVISAVLANLTAPRRH